MPSSPDARIFTPAAARNKDVIAQALLPQLPEGARVLEIASGSGEHGLHFCNLRPDLNWQPTNREEDQINSVNSWREDAPAGNIAPCRPLDVTIKPWNLEGSFDALFNANMIHISPWEVTLGLFEGAASILKSGGRLYLYGPYRIEGVHTAPSNAEFDQWLKAKDPRFGVRDIDEVSEVAGKHGIRHIKSLPMPANNFIQVFEM